MKKLIIVLAVVVFFLTILNDDNVKIPDTSIRFRIIASSNSLEDQKLKQDIKNELINKIIPNLLTNNSIDTSRMLIKNSLNDIDTLLKKYNIKYNINYGNNYFPQKIYKGVIYPQGNYESLVITLGEGLGNNWWCVLYPPLCLIEDKYSNDNIELRSYVKDVILKFNHL